MAAWRYDALDDFEMAVFVLLMKEQLGEFHHVENY